MVNKMSRFGIFNNDVKTPMAINYKPEQAMRIIGFISEYEKTKNKLVRWLMFLQIKAVLYWYN